MKRLVIWQIPWSDRLGASGVQSWGDSAGSAEKGILNTPSTMPEKDTALDASQNNLSEEEDVSCPLVRPNSNSTESKVVITPALERGLPTMSKQCTLLSKKLVKLVGKAIVEYSMIRCPC